MDCPAAHPLTPRFAAEEKDCPAAVPLRAVLTSCPLKLCVCVGCVWLWLLRELATVCPTLYPDWRPRRKRPPVIGYPAADNPDQFRIYCAGYGLPVTFQPVISVRRP